MEHLRVDGRAFDRLTNVIDSLRPGSNRILRSRSVEAAGELLLGTYVEVIGSADLSFASILRQRVAYRHEVMRRADAAMRSLIGKGYSSAQFCRSLGMSERNLELYFHQSLGLSPKAWFQCLSLHQARMMLRLHPRGKSSVTETALACGFEHFGRFAEAYRDLFGERPSETLRSR